MKSTLASTFLLAAGLLGPHAFGQDSRASRPTTVEPLAFAWPLGSPVRVREKTEKHGRILERRYMLRLETLPGSRNFALRVSQVEILQAGSLKRPEIAERFAPYLALQKLLPDLEIARDGNFVRAIDLTETLEHALALLAGQGERGRALAARTRHLFESPQARMMLEQMAAGAWRAWVGVWLGLRLGEGQHIDSSRRTRLPGGAEIVVPFRFSNMGRVERLPGHVQLAMRSESSGESARKAMVEQIQRVIRETGGEPLPADQLEQIRMTLELDAVARRATLQPLYVRRKRDLLVKMKGKPESRQIEMYEYWFDWSPRSAARPPQGGK